MQASNIFLIILLIFVQAYTPLPVSQPSSNNYISLQQIIQPDILPECSFLDNGQCSSSKSVATEPAANHEISNVVVDQSCSYMNGGSSVTPMGQIGSPLGEITNTEFKDLHEFVNDLLDNGNSLTPSFCSVESAIRYLGRNIDGDQVQNINVDEGDLFSDIIGFFKSTKLNQSAKVKV